jgi:hypothetical protein
VRDELVGRVIRALRHRRGWRQRDVAASSGVSRAVISDLEAGRVGPHAFDALRAVITSCGGVVRLEVGMPGGDARRLLDADHAALQGRWMSWLRGRGWTVDAEVTFNHHGERGSVDLMAWHSDSRTLLVAELKTVIVDVQAVLSSVDRKRRVARSLAHERGWAPTAVVPALLVLEGSTARRRIAEHAALFAGFALRGPGALRWLRGPAGVVPPVGILCFTSLSPAHRRDRRRAGRQRVRLRATGLRSDRAPRGAPDRPEPV